MWPSLYRMWGLGWGQGEELGTAPYWVRLVQVSLRPNSDQFGLLLFPAYFPDSACPVSVPPSRIYGGIWLPASSLHSFRKMFNLLVEEHIFSLGLWSCQCRTTRRCALEKGLSAVPLAERMDRAWLDVKCSILQRPGRCILRTRHHCCAVLL